MKKQFDIKKLVLLNLPYLLMGLFATNFGEAWRLAQGANASEKFLSLFAVLPGALQSFWPSLHPLDLLVGLCCGAGLRLAVYLKSKNAKKYRHGMEYGSARWGTREDIAPYIDPVFQNNVILTKTESLTMNSRPKDPKTARNKNVLVIGGSGSGKTRFWLKPNLMQMHSSYVVTDPKGTILVECGKMLQRGAPKLGKDGKPMKDKHGKVIYEPYRIKVLNTINFKKSMLCWCRTSLWKMTSSWRSGAAWDTPYCCALRCSKPAVSQNQSFRRTKGGFCMKKYQIIYADPPWNYKVYSKKGLGRSAESHYPTMSIEDICALPVGNLADKDCALFLWVTIPCLLEGLSVLKAWGFTYKTVGFVWVKQNRKADSLFWGMGYWTRSNVELCILATKGHPKRINAAVHQVIVSHIEEHSKKPQEARERIVSLMGDLPRIELFARQSTPGWDVWGNEVDSSISFP